MSIKEQNKLIKEIRKELIHTTNMNTLKAFHIACQSVRAIIRDNPQRIMK